MQLAFPEDEIRPLSCTPLTRDRHNPAHIELNDVLGNYSLTLVDSLSTLAILASAPDPYDAKEALQEFKDGVISFVEHYGDGTNGPGGRGKRARGFDLDSKVQVFETVIRGVGGLLSAHQFAVGDLPIRGYRPIQETRGGKIGILWEDDFVYDGQLLRLAKDLAERLLPAFSTPNDTGIPYPRVNLLSGVPFYENSTFNLDAGHGNCIEQDAAQCLKSAYDVDTRTRTNSAATGSLVLEFATLSRLTNDSRFEIAAKRSFFVTWNRRSHLNLIGNEIDPEGGQWLAPDTGVSANMEIPRL